MWLFFNTVIRLDVSVLTAPLLSPLLCFLFSFPSQLGDHLFLPSPTPSPAVRWIYSFLKQWTSEMRLWGILFCFLNFPCWVFEQPHVPFPGSVFIYLLELEWMGGRALYFSMLCFLVWLHSKALMPFGQVSFCAFAVLNNIFFSHLFSFLLPFFLSPSCWPPFLFLYLSQIILPGFRNKFIFCKRILLYQVLHLHWIWLAFVFLSEIRFLFLTSSLPIMSSHCFGFGTINIQCTNGSC